MSLTYEAEIETASEAGQSFPTALLVSITDIDGETLTFKGVGGRGRTFVEEGDYRVPFYRLGYSNDASLTVETVKATLKVQAGSSQRTLFEVPIAATFPAKPVVTTNFTIADWDPVDGFAFDEASQVDDGGSAIANYVVQAAALGWERSPLVDDLPANLDFAPDTVPLWPEGDDEFTVDLTVAAENAVGIGLPSDAVTKTVNCVDTFYLDNSDWTATSIQDQGPAGLIDIAISGSSSFTLQAPWDELRAYVGPVPSGAASGTLLPSSWMTTDNTAVIDVGETVRIQSGVAVSSTAYSVIAMRRSDNGQFFICSLRKTTTVLALSVTSPTVVNAPTISSGLVSHSGTLKADIGTQLTGGMGAADWSGEASFVNQFRKGTGVSAGSEFSNALATYTPTSDDHGLKIWVRSTATHASGGTAQAISAFYDIVWPAPTVIGTLASQNYETGSGAKTISAAAVAAIFTGSGRTYSITTPNAVGATINSSTGEITLPNQAAAASASLVVSCSNSGGVAAAAAFGVVWAAPADDFLFDVFAPNLWSVVETPQSAGQTEGTITFSTGAINVPSGYQMGCYAVVGSLPTNPPAVGNTMAIGPSGTKFYSKATFPVGSSLSCTIYRIRNSDNEMRPVDTKTLTIQGFGSGTFPTPATSILTNANGRQGEIYRYTEPGVTRGGFYGGCHVALAYHCWLGNTTYDDKIVGIIKDQINNGGNCPPCRSGFSNQHEVQSGIALYTIAKITPRLWAKFSQTEQDRMEWLVKACGVASAWSTSDLRIANAGSSGFVSKVTKMDGTKNNYPRTNPNYQMANPYAVSMLAVFLGSGQAAKEFLDSSPFSTVSSRLASLGLTNAANGAFKTPRPSGAPTATEVNNCCANWKMYNMPVTDLAGLLARQIGGQNFDKNCFTRHPQSGPIIENGGRVLGSVTPALTAMNGRLGMPHEMDSGDGGDPTGVRTSATYSFMSFRMVWSWTLIMLMSGLVARNAASLQAVKAQWKTGTDWYDEMMTNCGGWDDYSKGGEGSGNSNFSKADDGQTYAYDVHIPMNYLVLGMLGA